MNHNNWMDNLPVDTNSFVNHLISSQVSMCKRKFEDAIRERLKKELRRFGIEFTDEGEFNAFCIVNVVKTTYTDRPFYNELFLIDKRNEKRLLLFGFSDRVDIDFSNMNKIKITVGEVIEVKKN